MRKKVFITSDHNIFRKEILDEKINEKKLDHQFDISNLVKISDSNVKLIILATKAELKAERNKMVKLQAIDLNYFCGKSHFEKDGTHNYFVFQTIYKIYRCFKKIGNNKSV